MSKERSTDDIICVFRTEFLFRANRPDHADAVSKRVLESANHEGLLFDSAVMYQKMGSGGLSRIIAKFVSLNRIVLVESRPTEYGPEATVLLDQVSAR